MGLGTSAAVVIGSFPIGESDRVVTFFSRDFGRVRGVARAARRLRSRFGGALELFTLGQLVFFDTGRSDLVRIDHFDVTHPFAPLRESLESLGEAAWVVEIVARTTGERDRQPALYGLLVRALRAMEVSARPARVAVCFGVRCLDVLGHRPRLDRCVECGRAYPFARPALGEGGVVCEGCRGAAGDAVPVQPATVAAFARLRGLRWEEAVASPVGRAGPELRALLDTHLSRLIGQPTRSGRFLREVRRLSEVPE
ncbi:MAG TPA: DNA repair protein RecO [Candidatus Binatia bacterium]|nr:DNA repair protein RecO [Candidatus Binatia bacterium]